MNTKKGKVIKIKISFLMTTAVAADITDEMMQMIFPKAHHLHNLKRPTGGNEWFLVLKPNETNTIIEDGDNNELGVLDVKIPRKLYSVRDENEDGEIITLLYPEEY